LAFTTVWQYEIKRSCRITIVQLDVWPSYWPTNQEEQALELCMYAVYRFLVSMQPHKRSMMLKSKPRS
jgi:hypothetical protein